MAKRSIITAKFKVGTKLCWPIVSFQVEFDTIEGGGKVVSVISEEEWTVSLGDRSVHHASDVRLSFVCSFFLGLCHMALSYRHKRENSAALL